MIDGGKGQLGAGLAPLGGFREQGVAVIALAKRIEEIFIPGRAPRWCSTTPPPSCSCSSGSGTRPTASPSPTTAPAATAP